MLLSSCLEFFNILVKTTCNDKIECYEHHLLTSHLASFFPACTPPVSTSAFISEGKLLCLFPFGSSTPVMPAPVSAPSTCLHQLIGSSRGKQGKVSPAHPQHPRPWKLFSYGIRCKPKRKLSRSHSCSLPSQEGREGKAFCLQAHSALSQLARAGSGPIWASEPVYGLYNKYQATHVSIKPINTSDAAVEVRSSSLVAPSEWTWKHRRARFHKRNS